MERAPHLLMHSLSLSRTPCWVGENVLFEPEIARPHADPAFPRTIEFSKLLVRRDDEKQGLSRRLEVKRALPERYFGDNLWQSLPQAIDKLCILTEVQEGLGETPHLLRRHPFRQIDRQAFGPS